MAFDQMNLNKGMPSWIQNLLDNHSVDAWSEDADAQECSNKPATAKYQGPLACSNDKTHSSDDFSVDFETKFADNVS